MLGNGLDIGIRPHYRRRIALFPQEPERLERARPTARMKGEGHKSLALVHREFKHLNTQDLFLSAHGVRRHAGGYLLLVEARGAVEVAGEHH